MRLGGLALCRLADRLSAERRRKFAGRIAEKDLFRSALAANEPPFNVLHVFGSGGVGKTTLLRGFAGICEEAGVPVSYVDARDVEPSPDSFSGVVWSALGLADQDSPFEALESQRGLRVVLVDTYEMLAPLGTWMREVILPRLPVRLLLVLAGREAPDPSWRVDPGWPRLVRPLRLQDLSREESQAYLAGREVPADPREGILTFTRGHPLAVAIEDSTVPRTNASNELRSYPQNSLSSPPGVSEARFSLAPGNGTAARS